MRQTLISKILLTAACVAIVPAAMAVNFAGTQTAPGEWTYTLTFDSLDNYSIFQPQTRIILSGLTGVTSATAPTSTDFPNPAIEAINLAWTPTVSNGGTVVQWTHAGSGTGNFGGALHVFGFKVFASGATSGPVALVTDGMSRDTGNVLPNGQHEVDISISVTGPRAANLSRILPANGSGQATLINTPFARLVKAQVLDASGNPSAGATVTFTAPANGASATPATTSATTDATGVATAAILTANATDGSYLVMATSGGLSAAFGLTNVTGSPNLVLSKSGSGQSAAVNSNFPEPLKALVVDNNGSPISGSTVTFAAPAAGPSATFLGSVTAVSDTNGVATSSTLKANGIVGQYAATATLGASSTGFNLTNEPFATVSAASYLVGPLAPDSIASSFGTNLAATTAQNPGVPLPTTLAGIGVKVRDASQTERPAGLYLASPGQVNFVIPTGSAFGSATVTIGGSTTQSASIQIARISPAIFALNTTDLAAAQIIRVSGGNQIIEEVYSLNGGQIVPKPIVFGAPPEELYMALFGTGIRGRNDLSNVSVTVGSASLAALYAGPQPQFTGLDQVNIGPLPRAPLQGRGLIDVVVAVEGQPAKTVKLLFQ